MDPAPKESKWPARLRTLAFVAALLQLLGTALFLAILALGERSRLTLIALYLPRHPLVLGAFLGLALAWFARRRWLVIVEVVASLLMFFPVMGFNVAMAKSSPSPIRVASYNVFFGKLGRPALVEEITTISKDVDIIVIQAAFSQMGDQLKERLPSWNLYQEQELILLTRWPIRSAEAPGAVAKHTPAMFIKVVVETPAGALRVYDVHPYSPRDGLFDAKETRDNIAMRDAQVAAATTAARSDVPPFVLIGDTNLPTLSSTGRRYFAGLTDAFDEAGFGFGYSFPAKRPWMRIDRAFGSDDVHFLDARVGKLGVSDHLPLFVTLEIDDRSGIARTKTP